MKVHDVVQGQAEWFMARVGVVTASRFSSIIQNTRMQYSAGAKNLIAEILAEKELQACLDPSYDGHELVSGIDFQGNPWTERGEDLEEDAAKWYAALKDVDVETVGFVTTDDGRVGGSPDRFVGDDGILEIKCRSAKLHMRMVLGFDEIAQRTQVQGYLWLTGRKWLDCIAFNPYLPKRIDRVYPDPAWVKAWEECLERFWKDFEAAERFMATAGDVVEGGNLLELLRASLAGKDGFDAGAFHTKIAECEARGIFDAGDVAQVLDDLANERWDDVRAMSTYMDRALQAEAVPA